MSTNTQKPYKRAPSQWLLRCSDTVLKAKTVQSSSIRFWVSNGLFISASSVFSTFSRRFNGAAAFPSRFSSSHFHKALVPPHRASIWSNTPFYGSVLLFLTIKLYILFRVNEQSYCGSAKAALQCSCSNSAQTTTRPKCNVFWMHLAIVLLRKKKKFPVQKVFLRTPLAVVSAPRLFDFSEVPLHLFELIISLARV